MCVDYLTILMSDYRFPQMGVDNFYLSMRHFLFTAYHKIDITAYSLPTGYTWQAISSGRISGRKWNEFCEISQKSYSYFTENYPFKALLFCFFYQKSCKLRRKFFMIQVDQIPFPVVLHGAMEKGSGHVTE